MPLNVGAPTQQASGAATREGKQRIVELSSAAKASQLPDPGTLEHEDTSFRHQLYVLFPKPRRTHTQARPTAAR